MVTGVEFARCAQMFNGMNEADSSHSFIIKRYNQHKPLPVGYAMRMTDSWCAAFVSVVGWNAGASGVIPFECSCPRMIEKFKAIGEWQSKAHVPVVGDVVFYDWGKDGISDHVGIVVSVDYKHQNMLVVEGNKSDKVGYRSVAFGAKDICGYGVPKYGATAKDADYARVASEIMLGYYGNGDYRTNALTAQGYDVAKAQEIVNRCIMK